MKATLYEALGVPQGAADEEVRAALRRLIRKYYAKTRDGQGNVEEALRFINHASRILSDPEHRQHYDRELSVTTEANTEQRIAHFVSNVAGTAQQGTATRDDVIDIEDEKALTVPGSVPGENPHHPGLTERVASFGRSTLGALALCALFGAFIAAAIVFVTPTDAVLVAKQVLVWLTLTLLALALVYGVVHGLAWIRQRRISPEPALVPQTDLAILNWRREKSVFLGTDAPHEDASWIFQLRMAELERAKAGRTSEPRPWNRLVARLFDYSIWGLVLALLLSALHGAGAVDDDTAFWVGHPLFAPILITLSWVPIEVLLIAALQLTPGKWLFGVYLQFSISDAYARRDVGKISAIAKGIGASLQGPDTALATSANDVDTTALFADRQARLSLFRGEGPRMLRAGNWRRATEICRAWSDLEFWSAEPWRCLGYSLQAQGYHQEAINAFRKAAQYDPTDRTLESAIDKSQRGIV